MQRHNLLFLLAIIALPSGAGGKVTTPDYDSPKVVYEFYLDHPAKMGPALHWLRALMNPLMDSPYDMAPEFMDIKVVIHGTEIVTLVKQNQEKYKDMVARMEYYSQLGVEFKVCAIAAHDFEYNAEDFQDFVELVPSAFTELVHWQMNGYALITPQVFLKTQSKDEIR